MPSTHITLDHPSWPAPRGCDVEYETERAGGAGCVWTEVMAVNVLDEQRDITHMFTQDELCEAVEKAIA